ncbi:MAG: hypothetical protein UT39_C0007G0019 [Candidatus Woesebacteria bacterium GW2011_GWA1_39_21]|uniref:Phosphoribosyl-ATP pyrophosphohydrolase n=1 Tax=Candidatus Woesebacteria bacterium GW2011_GWA1_39_21 TaxID=1618550 RepID=A0A0G0N5G2_9BACT|nr:MAG: hypothetical protein UT39_C0007G0019 [Candidatus Woesebacteria bacterium GW2011_GWA1_39_21]
MKKKIKKIYYKKLVRDKIPQRIKEAGGRYAVKLLKDGDFQKELLRKVEEEAGGLANAKTRGEVVSELGDTLDVVYEIKRTFQISDKELIESRAKEEGRKGGFKKKIFLVWAEDTGYKTNERKGKQK